MTSATIPPPKVTAAQRIVFYDIAWANYRTIVDSLDGKHARVTYESGTLELMTISSLHARLSRLFGRLVIALTEEIGIPVLSCGDMTCSREDLKRGMELDECFYLQHEPDVRGKDHLDFTTDPPPDLAVEVDITGSSERRIGIYQAFGVPEVWRYKDGTLTALLLNDSGTYVESATSRAFPDLKVAELIPFVNRRGELDENALIREFRDWVRSNVIGE